MSDKEFLIKYEELLNKDYCNCNEMNCIDNNSPRRILNIAKQLQEENQQLKLINKEYERLNNIINELENEKDRLGSLFYERNEENIRLNNIINELEKWLKYKKEQMEEFELYKRKETGAFWYSTMGDIETFIERIQELKGEDKE